MDRRASDDVAQDHARIASLPLRTPAYPASPTDHPMPPFHSVRQVLRWQAVRDQIESAIGRGTYGPGEKLPSERDLAQALQVSRVSIREALRSLAAIGVVESAPGVGCFVCLTPSRVFADSVRGWLVRHQREVVEMTMLRGAVDALAAEFAARRQDDEAKRALAEAHQAFLVAAACEHPSEGELASADLAFHMAVGAASGSLLLAGLMGELHHSLHEARLALFSLDSKLKESARGHRAVLDAIISGDPRGANRAMERHVRATAKAVAEFELSPQDLGKGA